MFPCMFFLRPSEMGGNNNFAAVLEQELDSWQGCFYLSIVKHFPFFQRDVEIDTEKDGPVVDGEGAQGKIVHHNSLLFCRGGSWII